MPQAEFILCDSREDWLQERRKSIGSSDLAAILGVSRFQTTPFDVYLSKVRGDTIEQTPAMRLGSALEPSIRELVAEEAEVGASPGDKHSLFRQGVFHSTPDGFALTDKTPSNPMEVKYQARGRHDYERDGIPLDYRVQCFQHMEVLDADRCLFGVVSRDQLYVEWVERNSSFMATAWEYAQEWWGRHIEKEEPPDLREAPLRIVKDFFPDVVKGKEVQLDQEALHKVEALRIARAEVLAAEKAAAAFEAWVRADIGDAEAGVLPDGRVITLKKQKRKGFVVEPTEFRKLQLPKKGA